MLHMMLEASEVADFSQNPSNSAAARAAVTSCMSAASTVVFDRCCDLYNDCTFAALEAFTS